MGTGYKFECAKCGYVVRTSGPWEFYWDKNGERQDYGHPTPLSYEALEAGVAGFSGVLYCPVCDKVSDIILVEFETPAEDALTVWTGNYHPMPEYRKQGAVKCPHCDNTDLILAPGADITILCPRCREGKMDGDMEWLS